MGALSEVSFPLFMKDRPLVTRLERYEQVADGGLPAVLSNRVGHNLNNLQEQLALTGIKQVFAAV